MFFIFPHYLLITFHWPFPILDAKVYVGNLGTGAGKGELERAFSYYGPLRTVWIARNPPGFAFVEFEDTRDAEDAVRGLDGKYVELSKKTCLFFFNWYAKLF